MFTVRNITDHRAYFLLPSAPDFDPYLRTAQFRAPRVTPADYEVVEAPRPATWIGGGALTWDGTSWTWTPPGTIGLDQRKSDLRARVSAMHERQLNESFPFDFSIFGAKQATLANGTVEPAGVRFLQCRPQDRERWQAVYALASADVAAGNPDAPMKPIRTEDDARIPVNAAEAQTVMFALQGTKVLLLEHSWDLKDAIVQAADHAALDALDLDGGWPA